MEQPQRGASAPRRATSAVAPRSTAIDAVRVVGIVAVVVGHVLAVHPAVRAALYSWHVPVFFVLTGYLWTHGRELGDEVRRRARTLGRPYVAWLVVIGVPWVVYVAVTDGVPAGQTGVTLAVGAGLGRPFSAFWFVAALFFSAVLWRLVEAAPRFVAWLVALVGVVAAYLAAPVLAGAPLSVGVALLALVFLLAGQELRRGRARIARPGVLGGALLVVGGVLVASGISAPLDMKAADLGTPVVSVLVAVVLSVGMILVAEVVVPAAPAVVRRVVTTLAASGLVVVLVHAAVLWVVVEYSDFPRPVTTVIVLVVSWVIGHVVVRSPAAPWLAGRPRVRHADRAG